MKTLNLFISILFALLIFFNLFPEKIPLGKQRLQAQEFAPSNYDNWYYKKTEPFKGWNAIIIHHSATEAGSVKAFDRFHTKQGYGGVAYHFVIGNGNGMKDGKIQSTFRWKQQISGTHVSVNSWKHNIFGIGICLVGNFEKSEPTPAQKKALRQLLGKLRRRYDISKERVLSHKSVPFDHAPSRKESTKCPGKKLNVGDYINAN